MPPVIRGATRPTPTTPTPTPTPTFLTDVPTIDAECDLTFANFNFNGGNDAQDDTACQEHGAGDDDGGDEEGERGESLPPLPTERADSATWARRQRSQATRRRTSSFFQRGSHGLVVSTSFLTATFGGAPAHYALWLSEKCASTVVVHLLLAGDVVAHRSSAAFAPSSSVSSSSSSLTSNIDSNTGSACGSSGTARVALSADRLCFTPATFAEPQLVRVALAENSACTTVIEHRIFSLDANYHHIAAPSVVVHGDWWSGVATLLQSASGSHHSSAAVDTSAPRMASTHRPQGSNGVSLIASEYRRGDGNERVDIAAAMVAATAEPSVPAVGTPPLLVSYLAAGHGFSVAVARPPTDTLLAWGANTHGELGIGSTTPMPEPVVVSLAAVPAGVSLNGEGNHRSVVPAAVGGAVGIVSVSCGKHHVGVVTTFGRLFMWGNNKYGQLGLGDYTSRLAPQEVTCLLHQQQHQQQQHQQQHSESHGVTKGRGRSLRSTGVTGNSTPPALARNGTGLSSPRAALRIRHTLLVPSSDIAGATREASSGGYGNEDDGIPRREFAHVTQVACGAFHTLVVIHQQHLLSMGYNQAGQLGVGHRLQQNLRSGWRSCTPTRVDGLRDATCILDVAAGQHHSACVLSNGAVYTWGCGDDGRLGVSEVITNRRGVSKVKNETADANSRNCGREKSDDADYELRPTSLLWLRDLGIHMRAVRCGARHTAAISDRDLLYIWGANEFGQLGTGDTRHRGRPVLLTTPTEFVADGIADVTLGEFHSACVTLAGAAFAWGLCHGSLQQKLHHGYDIPGEGTEYQSNCPERISVPIGEGARQVACGWAHTLVLTTESFMKTNDIASTKRRPERLHFRREHKKQQLRRQEAAKFRRVSSALAALFRVRRRRTTRAVTSSAVARGGSPTSSGRIRPTFKFANLVMGLVERVGTWEENQGHELTEGAKEESLDDEQRQRVAHFVNNAIAEAIRRVATACCAARKTPRRGGAGKVSRHARSKQRSRIAPRQNKNQSRSIAKTQTRGGDTNADDCATAIGDDVGCGVHGIFYHSAFPPPPTLPRANAVVSPRRYIMVVDPVHSRNPDLRLETDLSTPGETKSPCSNQLSRGSLKKDTRVLGDVHTRSNASLIDALLHGDEDEALGKVVDGLDVERGEDSAGAELLEAQWAHREAVLTPRSSRTNKLRPTEVLLHKPTFMMSAHTLRPVRSVSRSSPMHNRKSPM